MFTHPILRFTFHVSTLRHQFTSIMDKKKCLCYCDFLIFSFTTSPGEKTFEVKITSPTDPYARIWIQVLDRNDGSFLVRYRMYASYTDLHVQILLKDKLVGKSPYVLKGEKNQVHLHHIEMNNVWKLTLTCFSLSRCSVSRIM